MVKKVLVFFLFLVLLSIPGLPFYADDSGAEVAAGGITFKKIPGISMEKEILVISKDKVDVTFLFKNNTNKDIETEVAFPVPLYPSGDLYGVRYPSTEMASLGDFSVWIEDKPIQYSTQAKALLEGKDFTDVLNQLGVSIANFSPEKEIVEQKLSKENIAYLKSLNLIKYEYGEYVSLWDISLTYHWLQIFPAKKVIKIRHTYTPIIGYEYIYLNSEYGSPNDYLHECPVALLEWGKKNYEKATRVFFDRVRYILMTGNNWGGPIKEFTLKIDNAPSEKVLLCSDLSYEQTITSQIEIHRKNYRPTRDLVVIFAYLRPDLDK